MPGSLMHLGATVLCAHAGQAQPTAPNPRVRVMGQPVVTMAFPYAVAGCANPAPPGPCVTAQWLTSATRIKVMGQPVLLQDSQAVCLPTGTALITVLTQTRVRGM